MLIHVQNGSFKAFLIVCLIGVVLGRSVPTPLSFTLEDLHLEDIEDGTDITTKLLVKRATDAIVFKEDDVKDTDWQFSYKTDSHEHEQKGVVRNGELSVVGAYSVNLPDGYTQTTMYVADKDGFRPQVQLRFADLNLLKSAIG